MSIYINRFAFLTEREYYQHIMAKTINYCIFKERGNCTNPCEELPSSAEIVGGERLCYEQASNDEVLQCDRAELIRDKITPAGDELDNDSW